MKARTEAIARIGRCVARAAGWAAFFILPTLAIESPLHAEIPLPCHDISIQYIPVNPPNDCHYLYRESRRHGPIDGTDFCAGGLASQSQDDAWTFNSSPPSQWCTAQGGNSGISYKDEKVKTYWNDQGRATSKRNHVNEWDRSAISAVPLPRTHQLRNEWQETFHKSKETKYQSNKEISRDIAEIKYDAFDSGDDAAQRPVEDIRESFSDKRLWEVTDGTPAVQKKKSVVINKSSYFDPGPEGGQKKRTSTDYNQIFNPPGVPESESLTDELHHFKTDGTYFPIKSEVRSKAFSGGRLSEHSLSLDRSSAVTGNPLRSRTVRSSWDTDIGFQVSHESRDAIYDGFGHDALVKEISEAQNAETGFPAYRTYGLKEFYFDPDRGVNIQTLSYSNDRHFDSAFTGEMYFQNCTASFANPYTNVTEQVIHSERGDSADTERWQQDFYSDGSLRMYRDVSRSPSKTSWLILSYRPGPGGGLDWWVSYYNGFCSASSPPLCFDVTDDTVRIDDACAMCEGCEADPNDEGGFEPPIQPPVPILTADVGGTSSSEGAAESGLAEGTADTVRIQTDTSAPVSFVIRAEDEHGFPLEFEICNVRAGTAGAIGSMLPASGGCPVRTNPAIALGASADGGIFHWDPGYDEESGTGPYLGTYEFTVRVSQDTSGTNYESLHADVTVTVDVRASSKPEFTKVELVNFPGQIAETRLAVDPSGEYRVHDGSKIEIEVGDSDEAGEIQEVKFHFRPYGRKKDSPKTLDGSFNPAAGKWRLGLDSMTFRGTDYRVTITAKNDEAIETSFGPFNIEMW